jgi:hypothetical protein
LGEFTAQITPVVSFVLFLRICEQEPGTAGEEPGLQNLEAKMTEHVRTMMVAALVGLGVLAGRAEAAPCAAEPTDMSVNYGDLISCEINPRSDNDFYRFSGRAGDHVLAQVAFVSGPGFDPRVEILAPNGASLGSGINVNPGVLPQTGTYTAIVYNAFSTSNPGNYTFTVACTGGTCLPSPPPPPSTPPATNTLCEPEPTDEFPGFGTRVTCDIAPNSDNDFYRFSGATGDRIVAEVAYLGGSGFDPRVEVIAPNGTSLGSGLNVYPVLPQSGTYTAIVYNAFSTSGPGQYAFTVTCIGGSCLPPPGRLPAITLTLTGCTICHPGNQFTVQAHLTNPESKTMTSELKFGLRLPDGTSINTLGNKHIEIPFPAGLNTTANLLTFTWPAGMPQGAWTVEATLLGPDLGDTSSRAVKTFTSAP